MKLPGIAWRAMTGYDLDAVVQIAGVVHPDFPESPEVLAERQRLYHFGAYLLEVNERPAGYILSHPWVLGTLPRLNTLIEQLPAEPDTYYIHDLALLPVARRVGAASYITNALAKHARAHGFPTMSLVAVNDSQGFWARHEFQLADIPELFPKLLSYDSTAQLMVRRL
ncbi:MAG TPA: GNAT family N-acetyltransferase [Devosia sp.]|jgi:ribosomal protein S18 acetylase RimI-like enzyme|nr:GNAT family N-acetyltransferase [Devosia sp.]